MFHDRIQSVSFAPFTAEEIKTLAVKKVTSTETYDALLHPLPDGLYDTAFGPNDRDERCDTCGLGPLKCPGHFGYIDLPLPVYHPMFFQLMLKFCLGSCFTCHRLIPKLSKTHLFVRQSELLDKEFLTEANDLKDVYTTAVANATSTGSATEIDLQMNICNKVDEYYHSVINNAPNSIKTRVTKHLVKTRLDLVNSFIKNDLKANVKVCPHCKSVKRKIRQEYNTRVYFKSVGSRVLKKLSNSKTSIKTDEETSPSTTPTLKESTTEFSFNQSENFEGTDDVLENEDDELGGQDVNENEEQENTHPEDIRKAFGDEYVTPEEIKNHLIQLWNTDGKAMRCLLGSYNVPERKKKVTTPEIFFLDVVAVPPSRFRPQSFMGEKRFENPQTSNLNKILWTCKLVKEILIRMKDGNEEDDAQVVLTTTEFQRGGGGRMSVPGKTYKEQLNNAWNLLQTNVNTYMDSTMNKLSLSPVPGVRQLLEKKEGLFRKHMMGKRVNYACRSVISPDLYINTDEIGVPLVFASKLTYAQPVTPWNLNQLQEMVINGPKKYPGAVMVELEDGKKQILTDDENERRAIAKKLLSSNINTSMSNQDRPMSQKKVYRHVLNGDVMLLNRQPTLHRPSIMAHKVKVLPNQRTLRLHYANCKSYNADFDGDEMNAHFPQNELARAEAYNLVSTNFNYLSPKDGKPLAGLIQDHVVSGVRMTSRDAMFNREDYQQLIFNGLIDKPGRIKLLPPCILKPKMLWSGKQVFSSVLLNIIPKGKYPLNMAGNKAKISDANWPKGKKRKDSEISEASDPFLLESQVIVRGGELMTGILDKTQYGSTAFSLVHCVFEIYGGVVAGKLLSVLARLFTAYLQHTGFTLGVQAILVLPHAEEKRRDILKEGRKCGDGSAIEAMNLDAECDEEALYERLQEAHYTNQGAELRQLDLAMKTRTDNINNKVNSVCMRGLLQKFPYNSLQLMVQSGAKGSSVNTMQISCLLGQIELEGRRPPLSMSGRSLPSFLPYDTSPRAGGFVDGRFLTGIRPQEYFFHCMAGREGLIDTAVKTSRSGYLQRCLIKHIEALYVQYDMTVRDGDGSVVQFLYGDDGIDVLKCQFLQKTQFKTVVDNHKSYVSILKPNEMSKVVDVKKAKKIQRKQDKWTKRNGEPFSSRFSHNRPSPFNLYENDSRRKVEKKYPSKKRENQRTEADWKLMERWNRADGPTKESYVSLCTPSPDPTLSKFNPACYFGAASEKFRHDVRGYMEDNPDNMLDVEDDVPSYRSGRVSTETFEPMMLIKFMRSLVEPGEAVGLLAAQSIGEPSTQMTLNTFHFAGRGEMNVTLGIPRLREILMTASENIKTPQMDVLITAGKEEAAKSIAKKLTKIKLIQVLDQISVKESLERTDLGTRMREFKVRLGLLPSYTYEDITEINAEDIMTYIETIFIRKIYRSVYRAIQEKKSRNLVETAQVNAPSNNQRNIGEEEDNINEAPPDEPDDQADLSDEDAENDGDADNIKGRDRRTQFTSYDDPDNQQEEMNENMNEDSRDSAEGLLNIKSEFADGEMEKLLQQVDDEDDNTKPFIPASFPENPRVGRVLRMDGVTAYMYDPDNQWCEVAIQFPLTGSKIMLVSLIEKLAEKAVVHEASGIHRGMVSECKDPKEAGRSRLKFEGVNLQQLWQFPDILDLDTLYSNNIHKIAKSYGIEAGRRVLIKEVQDVFKVYGIQIDPRHLSLIADYMTYEGVYKPFNRIGIESNPFPFQKMSFETSTHFLKAATAFGQPDDLGSPSSRIVVGRVIGQGTGIIDLIPKLTV